MCARYELTAPAQNIIERFGLTVPLSAFDIFHPIAEVRPTNQVPVIGVDGKVVLMRWGLDVPWQKQPLINARAETAAQKPTFKPLLEQRVSLPATAYYEWRKEEKSKIKTRISVTNADLFAMAGFYDQNRFVVLTCDPAPGIAHIHNRMPVILSDSLESDWINPDLTFDDLAPRLVSSPDPLTATEMPGPKPKQTTLFS